MDGDPKFNVDKWGNCRQMEGGSNHSYILDGKLGRGEKLQGYFIAKCWLQNNGQKSA